MGVAEAGLAPDEFWELSPIEFYGILEAVRKREERIEKKEWEQARYIAYYCVWPHLDNKTASKLKPKDLGLFPWEQKPKEKKKLTIQELDKIIDSWGPLEI